MALTSEQKEKVRELRLNNFGYKTIADELNVKRDQVRDYCRQHNLDGERASREQRIACANCGKLTTMNNLNAKFCSDKCRRKYNGKHRGNKQECKQCSKTFYEYKKRLFCSLECRRSYETENKKSRPEYIPKPKQIKTCINCNKEYETHQTESKYCSYECRYESSYRYMVERKPTYNIKCKECGKWFSTTNKGKKYCSVTCSDRFEYRKKETIRRERIKQNGRIDWDISIERLIHRDKGICYLCGEQVKTNLDPNHDYYPSIEHVIPVAKGGTHTWDNVKLAHRKCNYLKSDKFI